MTDEEHDRPEAQELAEAAPPPEARRRLPRPAPQSDVKAYIPPAPLPENQDDARRTQELSRVQISPDLDPRRRPTVRRSGNTGEDARASAREDASVVEETAPLGTNLRAIQEANRLAAQGDPWTREPATEAPGSGEPRTGPRGTVLLNPRARGGTKMMIAGVAESAALPPRRGSDAGDGAPPMEGLGLRVVVLGAVVVLGLATLALFASRGIVSPSREAPARTEAAPRTPEPEAVAAPPSTPAATSEPEPSANPGADDVTDEAATSAAPRRGRGRVKPVKRAPGAAASGTPRAPMFERPEGH